MQMLFIHLDLNYLVKPLAVKQDFNSKSMLKKFISWGFKSEKKNNNDGQFVCDCIKFLRSAVGRYR